MSDNGGDIISPRINRSISVLICLYRIRITIETNVAPFTYFFPTSSLCVVSFAGSKQEFVVKLGSLLRSLVGHGGSSEKKLRAKMFSTESLKTVLKLSLQAFRSSNFVARNENESVLQTGDFHSVDVYETNVSNGMFSTCLSPWNEIINLLIASTRAQCLKYLNNIKFTFVIRLIHFYQERICSAPGVSTVISRGKIHS